MKIEQKDLEEVLSLIGNIILENKEVFETEFSDIESLVSDVAHSIIEPKNRFMMGYTLKKDKEIVNDKSSSKKINKVRVIMPESYGYGKKRLPH
jgi:hypothetical protein